MAARPAAATRPAQPELVITRILDAPRPLVFRAWTDPALATDWWGPRGFVNLSCEMDVRPGGAWRRRMRSPAGTVHCKRGIYREVVAPELLVFTYLDEEADGTPGPETLVTVTFEDHAGGTRLTLHHGGFASAVARDAHQGGWTSCLDRFADYLAAT